MERISLCLGDLVVQLNRIRVDQTKSNQIKVNEKSFKVIQGCCGSVAGQPGRAEQEETEETESCSLSTSVHSVISCSWLFSGFFSFFQVFSLSGLERCRIQGNRAKSCLFKVTES